MEATGLKYVVGVIYSDPGEIALIGSFDNEIDADKLFTRLEDRRFPGDGIIRNFIETVTHYTRKN